MIVLELFRPDEMKSACEERETKQREDTFHINLKNIKKMFKSHNQKKNEFKFGQSLSKLADTRISKPLIIKKVKVNFFDNYGEDSDINKSFKKSITSTPQ